MNPLPELLQSKVVHITSHEWLSSVFPAQVVTPMCCLRQAGVNVALAIFMHLDHIVRPRLRQRRLAVLRAALARFGGQSYVLPSPPQRIPCLWREAHVLRLLLRWLARGGGQVILHCRNGRSTDVALTARGGNPRVNVVYDCRGIEPHEHVYERGYSGEPVNAPGRLGERARALLDRQARAVNGCDEILCVSNRMKEFIVDHYPGVADKIAVVPCCVDMPEVEALEQSRHLNRLNLALDGKFAVAYCGSAAKWQRPVETGRVFLQIKRAQEDAHLLIFTAQQEAMRQACAHAGISERDRTLLTIPHAEMPGYLAACDVGLLIRDEHIVNQVASPVKFAEYLASGLPVLLTGNIGDYSECVRRDGLGYVLDQSGLGESRLPPGAAHFLAYYRGAPERVRRGCRRFAELNLAWTGHLATLLATYKRASTKRGRS